MSTIDLLLLLAGLVLSLMVFSYLLGDTLLFGIAMYTLVGVSAGFAVLVALQKVILPMAVSPLGDFPQTSSLLALVPVLLSALFIWLLFSKNRRVSGVPLGLLGGVLAATLVIGLTRGTLVPQLLSIVNAFDPQKITSAGLPNWTGIFEAFMMLTGVISVLFVFHHRKIKKQQDSYSLSWLDGLNGFGQVFVGLTFGALFVGLFSTGLVALIAYLQYLVDIVRLW